MAVHDCHGVDDGGLAADYGCPVAVEDLKALIVGVVYDDNVNYLYVGAGFTGIEIPDKVSKYGIDIDNLDNIGVTAIYRAIQESNLIVIDEIGKMELISPRFREVALKALDSNKKVLGTIMLNPHPFADEIKRHPKVKVTQLTRTNHTQVLNEIVKWLESAHNENYH